jgi:hypothetical protein
VKEHGIGATLELGKEGAYRESRFVVVIGPPNEHSGGFSDQAKVQTCVLLGASTERRWTVNGY